MNGATIPGVISFFGDIFFVAFFAFFKGGGTSWRMRPMWYCRVFVCALRHDSLSALPDGKWVVCDSFMCGSWLIHVWRGSWLVVLVCALQHDSLSAFRRKVSVVRLIHLWFVTHCCVAWRIYTLTYSYACTYEYIYIYIGENARAIGAILCARCHLVWEKTRAPASANVPGYDCNTLQHTATHCNTLQRTAEHYYALQRNATDCNTRADESKNMPGCDCNTLQYTATHCNTLQRTATHCNTLQHTATYCSTLLHTATQCYTLQHTRWRVQKYARVRLQHTATHCNAL